jgi:hypothetical protein
MRGLSDHCSVILSINEDNWSPRPSRMMRYCSNVPGYHSFVCEKWRALQEEGWGGYVMKETFKLIKMTHKEWNLSHAHNLPGRMNSFKERISTLETKGEAEMLSEEEVEGLHGLPSDLHSLARINAGIYWQ